MTRSVLFLILLPLLVSSFLGHNHHPYYVSVTEIEYSSTNKEIGIACKIFADDFEQALKEMYQTKIDLYNTKDTSLTGKQIAGYIHKHLQLVADGKPVPLQYLGFEIEGEAAWCYFSGSSVASFRQLQVFNDLLYEYKKEQVNLMHVKVNGNRKSGRLTSPDNRLSFDF
ncbi:MAG: hypothetical protein KF862_21615 [Chitinophagaceae bacterium]|nr:hypothetical protein [Chitinophagaceae bacterium]